MIELKTIDVVKDEYAKEHNYDNWINLVNGCLPIADLLNNAENEAIKAYAEHLLDYAAQEATASMNEGSKYRRAEPEVNDWSILNIKKQLK